MVIKEYGDILIVLTYFWCSSIHRQAGSIHRQACWKSIAMFMQICVGQHKKFEVFSGCNEQ